MKFFEREVEPVGRRRGNLCRSIHLGSVGADPSKIVNFFHENTDKERLVRGPDNQSLFVYSILSPLPLTKSGEHKGPSKIGWTLEL